MQVMPPENITENCWWFRRSKTLSAAIKSPVVIFETSGIRGHFLALSYNYLMSILPTSVEVERAFSAAGVLCSKIRSRLGDSTIDTLCF